MPRTARSKSHTGIYHIMLRSVNKQSIFIDREDNLRYLDTLLRFKTKSGYKLYGYCLMGNHIHLLIQECDEDISQAMKRIGVSYVYWYNKKYNRVGHLFQDRYKSESVEDDKYLLAVLRYIHQNPLKAKLVKKIDEYQWSSYRDYQSSHSKMIDFDFILNLFNSNREKAREQFNSFMMQAGQDDFLDLEEDIKEWSEEALIDEIYKLSGLNDPKDLSAYKKDRRDAILLKLREAGITIRQLSELTGLGRSVVERVTSE
jgi:putative transposase